MKFLLIAINFVFLFFCFTNSYSDEVRLNDIIPSTDLTVLIETGYAWGLTQINDGITEDISPYNGFISSQTEGKITLELIDEYDLSKFLLWNDVNVSEEGIRQFRLEFYNKSDTIISESQTFTANSQLNANEFVFDNIVIGVKKVNLVILTANHQIEIRELEFIGEKHCSCIVDSDSDGVIDQWDKCPNTPISSVVSSDGCHTIKGDISSNGKIDIEDSIRILQLLTYDNPSSGINYFNNFDNSDILSSFIYKENSSSCDLKGVQDGGVVMYCPDNKDNVIYLEKLKIENYNNIHIEVDVYSWDWNDGAPRIGIDFDASGSYKLNAWGPSEGYAFYFSDPHDDFQGNLCSNNDTCPSITKSLGAILDIVNVGTSKDKTYHLSIDMDNTGITFKVETDGNIVALMTSDDVSYRTGHIGLHCSEGWCRFDNLKITLD